MRTWHTLLQRLRYLMRRQRFEADFAEEVRFHIEARQEELERQGYAPDAARRRAANEFGRTITVIEDTRGAWRFRWFEDLVADITFALRTFRRRPTLTLTIVGCLALGIGANALIFSLVNAAFLHPLPYPDGDRIALVRFTPPGQPDQKLGTNTGGYFFIKRHNRTFQQMGALRVTGFSVAVGDGKDSARDWLQGGWMSPGLKEVFGVHAMIGHWFDPDDKYWPEVVISYGVWQRLYGGRADIVGQKMRLDRYPGVVIGVTPPGFRTLGDVDLWIQQPDSDLARAQRSPNRLFTIVGRLRPGVTYAEAQADLRALQEPLGKEFSMHQGWGLVVDSLREASVGYLRQPILILQGAVFLLLLIACANVAGLLLANALVRQKELGVRAAVGSTRMRILRQLLTENVLLSLTACAVGIALAWAALRMLVNTGLSSYAALQSAALDWTVIAFAVAISVATAVIFGMVPALHLSRLDVAEFVRDGGRATSSRASSRARGAFVVAQLGLAVVLLVGTGLLVRTLLRLNAVDSGIRARGLLAAQVPLPRALYENTGELTSAGGLLVKFDSKFADLTEQMRARLASLPGVQSAAAVSPPPLGGAPRRVLFRKESLQAVVGDRDPWTAEWYAVTAHYFETVGLRLLEGRTFTDADVRSTRPVVVINQTMARRYWGNENAIGRMLQTDVLDDPPREIVGVVRDVRQDRYQSAPVPQMYVLRGQLPLRMDMQNALDILVSTFVVRTNGDPGALIPAVRSAVHDINPTLSVSNARTVEDYASGQLQELRQYASVLAVFGAISVTLALIGIVGVMAQVVGQRAGEIAIRLALGARPADVLTLVLRHATMLIAGGVAIGTVASVLVTPVLGRLLWGVTAADPATLLSVVVGLMVIALAACCVPAWRALRVAPVAALRAE